MLYLLFGEPDNGADCTERLLPREDIQNVAGHGSEQLDLTDDALSRTLDRVISSDLSQPELFCDSVNR